MKMSTLFISHASFSSMYTNISWLGYISVEMDVRKDFPIHTATEKVNFSVPLSTDHIDSFNSSMFTVFSVSYSGPDRFPIFAIRVQFIEDVICSTDDRDSTSFQLYRRIYIIKDVLDVYLPHDHPVKELYYYATTYDYGYNMGTCRALIPGHECSQSTSHYQIIRIHHNAHKSLVIPHEIDISMTKTVNCSIECSLDIGILEYTHINDTLRFRYHEWRRMYRLTWQVISAKSRGFIVIINSTCGTCTKLCDVAVALGLPLTSNHMLDSTTAQAKYLDILRDSNLFTGDDRWLTFRTQFERVIHNLHKSKHVGASSNHRYGNWHDANAYCLARNLSLVAHPQDIFNQLTDLIGSVDPDHSWNNLQELYFAVFHRDGLVSGSNLVMHHTPWYLGKSIKLSTCVHFIAAGVAPSCSDQPLSLKGKSAATIQVEIHSVNRQC